MTNQPKPIGRGRLTLLMALAFIGGGVIMFGIGALLVESISRSDTPVVMAIAFIFSVLVVLMNLVADLLYGWLDPRVTG